MEEVFYVIALSIVLLVFTYAKLRFELHMMQLNSYWNSRYYNWLKSNFKTRDRLAELLVLIIWMLSLWFGGLLVGFITAILLYGGLSYSMLTKKQKKAVVFTKRAKRLFATTFALVWVIGLIVFFAAGRSLSGIGVIPLLVYLSFALIMLANTLLAPVEKSINQWYYNDAKKLLAQRPDLIIIGITGSYGKTSTKHFLFRMLSEKYNVLMTPGSYNTTMGVIKTIREELQAVHQVFIVEMGAKQPGDIAEISALVKPQIGILTAVGEQHLESFKTIANVQKTKFELIDALPPNGLAVLNADYEYIVNRTLKPENAAYYTAEDAPADYAIKDVSYSERGSEFSIVSKDGKLEGLNTKLLGNYNLSNVLASYIVAKHLDVSDSSIAFAIKKLEPVQHRMEVKANANGITVIDDAFNSNPVGSKMAVEVLKQIKGNSKIIITPGMIELGDRQEHYNTLLGEQIAEACDYVVLVGTRTTGPIMQGLKNKNYPADKIYVAQNFKDAMAHLNPRVKAGDVLLYENDLPDTYES